MNETTYLLKNIRLERAFEYDDAGNVVATKTTTAHLHIENGKIVNIYFDEIPETLKGLSQCDGGQALALPGINDAHIHLDKTYYGGPWRAAEENKSVAEMIQIEKTLLPEQLPVLEHRAKAILDLIISKGATRTLAHCNIDHSIGVQHFAKIQEILNQYSPLISAKTVAFPQHGLYRDDAVELMKEVLSMGCNYVGGLDPAEIDGNMQKSLDTTVQLALDYNVGIDFHIHERGNVGKTSLDYLFDLVEQNPSLKSKVNLSHAFVLYDIFKQGELADYAARMRDLGIKLVSGVPIQFKMPLAELRDYEVQVEVGTDSVMDHWYPFGQGDIIERSNIIAQLYGWKNEYHLSRALYFATGTTPLNHAGEMVWPQIGMDADIVLFDASCSAEVIARISARKLTIHKGKISYSLNG
ncbi:amidohydrolase [Acinetobacter bouvetii]|uniref:N-isopropylammelide isopropyl amidohydrolase n=1 Tax=Acinetobacter bouvetii TaxID=202951 RepID=A0A811GEZ5_9GAMM|nr:amidohydrolase [Acinetobacter bouvetii]CAB1221622.1 N-isopropylammelide isopropyl amidohydrolase [Acinetobacter bouvetii]